VPTTELLVGTSDPPGMGLGKFPHPQPGMGIPVVLNCYRGDGSGESIPDGDLPIAIFNGRRG
jgi:hypothetical protein